MVLRTRKNVHTRTQTQNHTQTHSHKMCTCAPEHVRIHARYHLHERAFTQTCISANMHASARTLARP